MLYSSTCAIGTDCACNMKAPIVSGLARAKHEYGRLLVARRCATASSKTLEVVGPSVALEQLEVLTKCQHYQPLQVPSPTTCVEKANMELEPSK